MAEPNRQDPARFLNRELSYLEFNARVLALAADAALPLLERVRFLAIFAQNLDQFFQVRVAGLQEAQWSGVAVPTPDGLSPTESLRSIRARVLELGRVRDDLWRKELLPTLAEQRIRVTSYAALGAGERAQLARLFELRIFPVLTPLSVDPAHPFPYISTLSLNLAVLLREPSGGAPRFARVKVPPLLPRFLALADGERFVPIEELIAAHLDALFPGMVILAHCPFRVTRDADLDIDLSRDDGEDLLLAIESGLRRRHRTNAACRLEVDPSIPDEVLELLLRELGLDAEDVYVSDGLIDLSALWSLHALERPELKDEVWIPQTPPRLAQAARDKRPGEIFEVLREGDVLVHHPYDSFQTSVQAFLSQAAADPAVLAIKHTLYRTSGGENPVVHTLIRAAEDGKQVVALIELRARFDEEANIEWARALEEAGVHVVYGIVGLKTHAKIALVVRQEPDAVRRYFHVGTGNYNPRTATIYEDVGLLSTDDALGADLAELFNYLTGSSRQSSYRRLLVAPGSLRAGLLAAIRREAEAPDGEIVIKVNNLSDPEIIDALYAASRAGARVDLVVRSVCCLRPGVPGLSENIRVRSILGRFLEHSRIFRFGSEARGRRHYIGSADLMPRNLDQRVELLAPVDDPPLCDRLDEILATNLADDRDAWVLGPDAVWTRQTGPRGISTQRRLAELARERSGPGGERAHGRSSG
jgi:polyphosphate kinase